MAVAITAKEDTLLEVDLPEVLFETRIYGGGTMGLNRRAYITM